MKVVISASNRKITVSGEDRVWDNGACYMIDTQTVRGSWGYGNHHYNPVISMTNVKKWLNKGALVQIGNSQYYKFDIEKLNDIINGGENNVHN